METTMTVNDFADFEDSATENGSRTWDAQQLMRRLGYENWAAFSKVINKAIASCAQLGIQIHETFVPTTATVDGRPVPTYSLTRFACFLTSMHADDKKPEVAAAKVYFAAIASAVIERAIENEDLERLDLRDEIKTGEKMLSSIAKSAGVNPNGYAFFKDAGIRGMYNMGLRDLMARRGIAKGLTLYDFMGSTELAGNYFRITQTAERIKSQKIHGQRALERTAADIGSSVRETMIRNSGIPPEHLPPAEDLNRVKSRLKTANRAMKKLDRTPAALPAAPRR